MTRQPLEQQHRTSALARGYAACSYLLADTPWLLLVHPVSRARRQLPELQRRQQQQEQPELRLPLPLPLPPDLPPVLVGLQRPPLVLLVLLVLLLPPALVLLQPLQWPLAQLRPQGL